MAMNFKKTLLAGTALVAVSFAHIGAAQAVDISDNSVVAGGGIVNGDVLLNTPIDNKFINIDLQNNGLTLGDGGGTAINLAGDGTGNQVYLYSTTASGKTVTLTGPTNSIAAGAKSVTIHLSRDNTNNNKTNNVNLIINKNVVSGAGGTVDIWSYTSGNVIDFTGDATAINLGSGSISLVDSDQVKFTAANAQTFAGSIAGSGTIIISNTSGVTLGGSGATINANALTINNNASVTISSGGGVGVASNISGPIALGTNNTRLILDGANLVTTGGITGAGHLTLSGVAASVAGGDISLSALESSATTSSIGNKLTVTGATNVSAGALTLGGNASSLQNVTVGGKIAFTHTGTNAGAVTIAGNVTGAGSLENGAGELKIGSATGTTVSVPNIKYTGAGTIALSNDVTNFASNVNFDGKAGTLKLGSGITNIAGDIIGGAGTVVMGADTNFAKTLNVATLTTNNHHVYLNDTTEVTDGITTAGSLYLDSATGFTVSGGASSVTAIHNRTGANTIANKINTIGGAIVSTNSSLNVSHAQSTLNGATLANNGMLSFGGSAISANVTAQTVSTTLELTTNTTTLIGGSVGVAAARLGTVRIAGTGTTTFGHADFHVDNLNFTAAGTANMAASVNSDVRSIDFAGHNGKAIFGDSTTFNGAVKNTGASGHGTLELGNNSVVKGAIGTTTEKIGTLRFNGIGTTESAVYANRVELNGGDVTAQHETFASGVHFASDNRLVLQKATTLSGNVTTAKPGTGALVFSSGFKKIDGNVERIRELSLNENATVTGTLHAANVTNVGGHRLTVGGAFTAEADTLLVFNVTGADNHGQIKAGGPATISADTNIQVSFANGAYLTDGQSVTLVDGTGGNGVAALNQGRLTQINTALLSFVQDTSNKEDLVLRVGRASLETKVEGRNNRAAARVLDQIAGNSIDPDIRALQTRLAAAKTSQALTDIVESITPDASGGTTVAMANVAHQTSTMVNGRLNDVRAGGSSGSGVATGNSWNDRHVWGQAFGATADQGKRGGIDGYDADTYGVVVGFDGDVSDASRLGLAFAYANTDVKGKDVNRASSAIDSWQVSLYGDYEMGEDYFLNGQLAYIYNDIDGKRHNVGGLPGNTAQSSYHSNQYVARAELGRDFYTDGRTILTPSVSANYNYIDTGSYTETGAGGLNLRNVSTDHAQMLEFGAHLVASMDMDDGNGGSIMPRLHGGYRYDVIGERVKTTASLAGGGAAFGTNGADPDQGTFNVGTGVKWSMQSDLELTAQYDYQTKNHYKEHSGYVRAGYRF